MISREKALELLHSKMQSQNLRKHSCSVAAVMRALAKHFGEDEDKWEIVGLLHDGDYEFTKDDPGNHAKLMADWVREIGETDEELLTGIKSHGWFHQGKLPKTRMQWALFCCDELTGLIIAVTLIRPEKNFLLLRLRMFFLSGTQKVLQQESKGRISKIARKNLELNFLILFNLHSPQCKEYTRN